MWVYNPKGVRPTKVPDSLKWQIDAKAKELIDQVLKPAHVQSPPENAEFNYIVDIYGKWHGAYFTFIAKYHNPRPDAEETEFERRFTRMKHLHGDKFLLSFMRYTGE